MRAFYTGPTTSRFYPMDQQNQNPTPTSTSATTSTGPPPQPSQTPAPSPQPHVQTPQSQPQPSSSLPPSSTTNPSTSSALPTPSNPIQNPNPRPPPQLQSTLQHQTRPPQTLSRTWQQSHLTNFSSPLSGASSASAGPSSSSSASPSPSASVLPSPRSGMAIGVPAHRPSPSPQQPAPFSSSYGHFGGGLGRGGVNLQEPSSNPSASQPQVRPPMAGMGMLGSLGSSSQMRPGGIPAHHQQRPVQSSLRPASIPSSQPPSSHNYQGHSLLRASSVGSPGSPLPSASQAQSLNQPWLASGSQGKPPLPSPSYRPQMNPQSMQQRAHIQQQHHSMPMNSQQQNMSSAQQQQPSPSQQTHEHYGQMPRVPQALSHQQQITRVQGSINQKSSSPAIVQSNTVQLGSQNRIATTESDESCNRILSKRSIHELVNQVDPSEKLDPEVEDILMDIAEEFVESITTFGCSLAKHRKSTTLEAKDILLHLERNWNITLPGFGSDEIKSFKKPLVNDIHKERLAAIKKSVVASETANTRSSAGQATGNVKGNLAKTPANVIVSPNVKT